jgi:AcrR family transcriptional regulator
MDELARRVGVSKPVIYDLVGSKEQVFRAAVDRAARELTDRVVAASAEGSTLGEQVGRGALAFFEFVAEHRRAWSMLLSSTAAPEAAEEVNQARHRQAGLLRDLLLEASAGRLDSTRAEAIAYAATGAFEAAATWWQSRPDLPVAALAELVAGLVLPGIEAEVGVVRRPSA